jgi:hypothetical protein
VDYGGGFFFKFLAWNFFLICRVGVESNWVHSTLRPLIGLLCQPRVIMMMEKLVEWLAGETLSTTNPTCSPDSEPGSSGWKPATNRLSYGKDFLAWKDHELFLSGQQVSTKFRTEYICRVWHISTVEVIWLKVELLIRVASSCTLRESQRSRIISMWRWNLCTLTLCWYSKTRYRWWNPPINHIPFKSS